MVKRPCIRDMVAGQDIVNSEMAGDRAVKGTKMNKSYLLETFEEYMKR